MKIPVLYTCTPNEDDMETAEMLECHTAQQLLDSQKVSWTAELKMVGDDIEITFHLDGQDVSEKETIEELIDPENIIATEGKEALVKKLKHLLETEEDLADHMGLLEQIFGGTIHLNMVEMKGSNGDVHFRFEIDIDVVPSFKPSFDLIC